MPDNPSFDSKIRTNEEARFEETLRPQDFEAFVGQKRVVGNLMIAIRAAKDRGEPIEHVLFSGPPGIGKTTLAKIVAGKCGSRLIESQGPVLEKKGDLAGLLTNLAEGDILFIDEIHRLRSAVEEILYAAMEDFALDILLGEGASARSIRMKLPRFTLVGATTRDGLLAKPFRTRFGIQERLEYYPDEDLEKIVVRSARILGVEIEQGGARIIAGRARGTPRIANRYLRRTRDLAQLEAGNRIGEAIAEKGLEMLGIDEYGLDRLDRKILDCLLANYPRPVGLKTVCVSVGESEDTVEEVYEPFLIRENFILKTPQGRLPTEKALRTFAPGKKREPDKDPGKSGKSESGGLF